MLAGTHLGIYEIVEEIGRGGMATVYRARQSTVDRDVAIKMIQGGLSDPAAIQRFQREARLVARLEHPHILPVYDFDGAHDPPYIVMRYLDGGTLDEILMRGALPVPETAALMRQLCSGLDYAHRQGVTHRDVKPSNILIDRDGNAFLSDFGIARAAEGPSSMRLTVEGMVLGSVEYMSPEQIMGRRDVDYRSDLYSLGVLLFQMLTGQLPYVSDPPLGVLAMHLSAPVPSACALCPDMPPAVDEVITRALAKAPEDRFHNAVSISAALDAALGSTQPPVSAPLAGYPLPRPPAVPAASITAVVDQFQAPDAFTAEEAPAEEHNRQIVALYANAAEYAEMVEDAADRESAHRAMAALWDAFTRIAGEHGGVPHSRSDSDILVVWGASGSREDDPERAILAALAMQSALRELCRLPIEGEQLPLNIGIHTGIALVTADAASDARTGAISITGATISLANRLMQAAYGTILITHDLYRQVRGVFEVQPDLPLRVRGRVEGVPTFRVSAAKPRAFRPMTRGIDGLETRMIGREAEMRRLQHAFLNAIEDAETQVVTITGEAGVGKSRLLDAFEQWCELRPEMFYLFRARATGTPNRPYALLRSMIGFRFMIHDDDPSDVVVRKLDEGMVRMAESIAGGTDTILADPALAHRIGHLCGYNLSSSPHIGPLLGDPALLAAQSRRAFIDFFLTLSGIDNVMLELEDLHLADDTSLELLNELFTASADSPEDTHLVAICAARPALFSRRPDWASGKPYHARIELPSLDRRESRELVREILRNLPEVPRALRDLLVERSEGNPYYMEELVKKLIDDRVIIPESDNSWRVEESRLGALKVPPSLAALIEARFDTLLAPERMVLLRAALYGRVFFTGVLYAMDEADVNARGTAAHIADLPGLLEGLERRGFIHRHETSILAGSDEYAFSQSILRDVVYDLLLERQRRVYHRAAADWLAELERADEYLTQIADHYEQAGAWDEAALALERAGERAFRRGLFREAEDLYERGLAFLPEGDDALRLDLLLGLGAAAGGRGDLSKAQPVLEEALALARATSSPSAEARARYLLGMSETMRGAYQAALAQFDKALPLARKKADRRVLSNVLYGLADTYFRHGDYPKALKAAVECRMLARELGDDVLLVTAMNRIATIYQMSNEHEAARALLEETLALARRIGHKRVEVSLLINKGVVHLVQENFSEAARSWEAAQVLAREAGDLFALTVASADLAIAYVRCGELSLVMPAAVEALRSARAMHSDTGLLRGLLGVAEMRLESGDTAGGMALAGLARNHPAAAADHVWGVDLSLKYWRERLNLTPEQILPLLEAGKALDLNQVVDEILA